ncbi:MAG: TetR/AcrR family transcriptional regulator [Smithellaceae bacterium]|nr:TetR/AcrR family transcriptional regulator [Syntrophaceae bacterium]MDD4240318.1 TetR/AcrR family transcriptional regulator [Smithellaceae bacterium]NLX50956.1 TetR/AcrR family transcriptional regulator [Deltaproteobacteria bacterium]
MEKMKTADKILNAARASFAEDGYSGTHMDAIALRAGVNKAALYYHIGDKDTLYARVLHEVLGNVAEGVKQTVAAADGPEEKLRSYIRFMAAVVIRNPELPPIMMRELAAGGVHLPRLVVEDITGVLAILMGILEDGRKQGIFTDIVPFLVHTMIMGTILLYSKGEPIKDRLSWLPASLKHRDRKLKGSLGDAVGELVLKAIKK